MFLCWLEITNLILFFGKQNTNVRIDEKQILCFQINEYIEILNSRINNIQPISKKANRAFIVVYIVYIALVHTNKQPYTGTFDRADRDGCIFCFCCCCYRWLSAMGS